MSTEIVTPEAIGTGRSIEAPEARKQRRTAAVFIAVVGLLLLWGGLTRSGTSFIALSDIGDDNPLPTLELPGGPVTLVCAVTLLAVGVTMFLARLSKPWPAVLGTVAALALVCGFMVWSATGAPFPFTVTNQLNGTLQYATPIMLGAMCGVLSERAGVVNVAIEGQMILAAFTASVVAGSTGSLWAGLFAAMLAGILSAALLAVFALQFLMDHVVLGVVINLLVAGFTDFMYHQLIKDAGSVNSVDVMAPFAIPGLEKIPFLGPILFAQRPITYIAIISVVIVWFVLYKTKWGLRVRSVGEHPHAADTVGINVISTKFQSVLLGGVFAGFAGAFFTIGNSGAFQNSGISAGNGFIALAAVIMGRWHPVLAALMALFFGFTRQLAQTVGPLDTPMPSELLSALPYLFTIVAVAGLIGRVRAPAADGQPYVKSH